MCQSSEVIVYWSLWFWLLRCFWFCLRVSVLFPVSRRVCGSSLKRDIGACFNRSPLGVGTDRNAGFLSSERLKPSCCFSEVYHGWWFLRASRLWWCWGSVPTCFCFLTSGIHWLPKKRPCNTCIVFEFASLDLRFGDVIASCRLLAYVQNC